MAVIFRQSGGMVFESWWKGDKSKSVLKEREQLRKFLGVFWQNFFERSFSF